MYAGCGASPGDAGDVPCGRHLCDRVTAGDKFLAGPIWAVCRRARTVLACRSVPHESLVVRFQLGTHTAGVLAMGHGGEGEMKEYQCW